jgi:hypothetical protein
MPARVQRQSAATEPPVASHIQSAFAKISGFAADTKGAGVLMDTSGPAHGEEEQAGRGARRQSVRIAVRGFLIAPVSPA